MSHVASVKIKIKDLDALKAAAEECGLQFRENQTSYKWYGKWVQDYHADDAAYKNGINPADYGKCVHALRNLSNPAGYEVGVIRDPQDETAYTLIWDFYGQNHSNGLIARIGRNGEKLKAAYAKQATISQLKQKGFSFEVQTQPDGSSKIVASL